MTLITFIPASGYDASESGVINIGEGIAFDVHTALQTGGGQIIVDDAQNPHIAAALQRFVGLVVSGTTQSSATPIDVKQTMMIHNTRADGTPAQPGDILIWQPDGSARPIGSTSGGGSGDVSSSAGVNAPLVNGSGVQIPNIPAWRGNTLYPTGYVVQNGGIAYAATTTFTSGASFGADGANWAALSSSELGYTEITSSAPASPYVNGLAASPTTIPGLSVTAPVGSRPIEIVLAGSAQNITANAVNGGVVLYEDGTLVDQAQFSLPAVVFSAVPLPPLKTRRNPAAGSHTYLVKGFTSNATNTWWVLAGATQKASISVIQR